MTDERWELRPGAMLHRRCWDDGCVLYDEVCGRTVFLDEVGNWLVQRLQKAPMDTGMLIASLADRYDMAASEIPRRAIVKRLRELQALEFLQVERP